MSAERISASIAATLEKAGRGANKAMLLAELSRGVAEVMADMTAAAMVDMCKDEGCDIAELRREPLPPDAVQQIKGHILNRLKIAAVAHVGTTPPPDMDPIVDADVDAAMRNAPLTAALIHAAIDKVLNEGGDNQDN